MAKWLAGLEGFELANEGLTSQCKRHPGVDYPEAFLELGDQSSASAIGRIMPWQLTEDEEPG
jgi:hypothetical protein